MNDTAFMLALALVALLPAKLADAHSCGELVEEAMVLELESATIDGEPADPADWQEDAYLYTVEPLLVNDIVFRVRDRESGEPVYTDIMDNERRER